MGSQDKHPSPDKHEVNFFLASSPRHALLSAGLALQRDPGSENHLFFIEHPTSARNYLELFGKWKSSPFRSMQVLESQYRSDLGDSKGVGRLFRKKSMKARFRRDNRRLIERSVIDFKPDNVFTGVDTYYEAQYALHFAKKRNPAAKGIYMEDGIGAYDYTFRDLRWRRVRDLIRRLKWGFWWKPCLVTGSSGWLDEGYVAFPDLVIDELKKLKLHVLPSEMFLTDEFRELALIMAEYFEVDIPRLDQASLIVILTRSNLARYFPGYCETMGNLCALVSGSGKGVAVKFHVGETDPSFIPLEDRREIYVVPITAIFELLIVLMRNPDVTVIGDASSCLIATRWLRPGYRVICLRHAVVPEHASYMVKQFQQMGVHLESDPRDVLEKYFSGDGQDRLETGVKPPSRSATRGGLDATG